MVSLGIRFIIGFLISLGISLVINFVISLIVSFKNRIMMKKRKQIKNHKSDFRKNFYKLYPYVDVPVIIMSHNILHLHNISILIKDEILSFNSI